LAASLNFAHSCPVTARLDKSFAAPSTDDRLTPPGCYVLQQVNRQNAVPDKSDMLEVHRIAADASGRGITRILDNKTARRRLNCGPKAAADCRGAAAHQT
jgi:hypothetical protein